MKNAPLRPGKVRRQVRIPANSSDPNVILTSDVSLSSTWTDAAKRQLFKVSATVVGTTASDQVQWCIDTERFQTGWIPCSWNGSGWTFGSLIQMLEEVGRGTDLAEFRPNSEPSCAIRLRKKIGAGSWSAQSVKFKALPPAGATVPNATASTRSELLTALNGYDSVGLAPYVIHLTADITISSVMSVSGIVKQGHPIVITSANRASPRRVSGYSSRAFDMTGCENIVFDRVLFWNNVTTQMGGTDDNGVNFPLVTVNGGQVLRTFTCSRIHITNCLLRDLNNALEFNDARNFWIAFNEFWGLSQDGVRFWKSSARCLVQGNYAHDPLVYQAWANDAELSGSNIVHPDFLQTAADNGEGPHTGLQFIGNRIKGFYGYFTGVFLKSAAATKDKTTIESTGVLAPEVRDNYFELGHGIGIMLSGGRDLISRNNVFRRFSGGLSAPTIHLWGFVSGTQLVENCVGEQAVYCSTETNPIKKEERQATVSGSISLSSSSWPASWPSGLGELAYPTGPDSYIPLAA